MKKFTKLFLSSALVAAMAMSSMVAFADGWTAPTHYDISGDFTGKYIVNEDSKQNVIEIDANQITPDDGTQATLLVFNSTSATAATQENVVGIDQAADAGFTNKGLIKKDETHTAGVPTIAAETDDTSAKYTVMVGYYASGTFTIKKATFTVNNGATEPVLMGDITSFMNVSSLEPDALVNLGDARAIVQIANNTIKLDTYSADVQAYVLKAGDVATFTDLTLKQGDGAVNLGDARAIVRLANGDTQNQHGLAGDTVE